MSKKLNDWRKRNKEIDRASYKLRQRRNRKFCDDYKEDKCCSTCGYKEHTEILQFHHIGKKTQTISNMANDSSIKSIEEEIKKCILLCPNCHYILHRKEVEDGRNK
jgi:hypothetical protein